VPTVQLKSVGAGTFIYERMVGKVHGRAGDGDLLAVVDKRGQMVGWGLYHSRSQIAVRMVARQAQRPADDWLARRVGQAVRMRTDTLGLGRASDAYRLIHAEGDGLSGLIVDRFADGVVIELFSLAMYQRLRQIEDAIIDAGVGVDEFAVLADKTVCRQEGFTLGPEHRSRPRDVVITEHGVSFHVRLGGGHKTGFFCDQRDNRRALAQLTPGKRVLDVCCYSGGFSCYAATVGHAASVEGVDLDEKAVAAAASNAELNGADARFTHADAFDYLRSAEAAGRQWDVVVVDPSKFVRRRGEMDSGCQKYIDLNRMACSVVRPGGVLLTCSCSGLVDEGAFANLIRRAAGYAGRSLTIFNRTGAAADHPYTPDTPEALYLKAIWAVVR
jgi:23S rRNA (cytosine1962-C5)-methyltransferase